jgi:hypothetical protein
MNTDAMRPFRVDRGFGIFLSFVLLMYGSMVGVCIAFADRLFDVFPGLTLFALCALVPSLGLYLRTCFMPREATWYPVLRFLAWGTIAALGAFEWLMIALFAGGYRGGGL